MWLIAVVLLLGGVAVFSALYLTDTLKLEVAGFGVAVVTCIAAILAIVK
jgi:hypothetical protein